MKFHCDKCNAKVSFWETFKLKREYVTKCKVCGVSLYPVKTAAFNWMFVLGFVSVILPAEIMYRLTANLTKTFAIATFFALIAIFAVAYYTYKTTEFRSQ